MDSDIATLREFEGFRLDPNARVLWHQDKVVALPLKAIDLLVKLTNRPGEILSKEDILDSVWGDTFVEESNLSHHIYLLRKKLGAIGGREYIETVPRRGYRFAADVQNIVEHHEVSIERRVFSRTVIEEIDKDAGRTLPDRAVSKHEISRVESMSRIWSRPGTAIIALVISALGAAALWASYGGAVANPLAQIESVAVLPIRSQGDIDDSLRYGITDSLSYRLAGIGAFYVRPSTSTLAYDHDLRDPIAIGRHMGVSAILDGRIQDEAGRIRLNIQLINITTGESIWSGQFNGQASRILDLQDEVFSRFIHDLGLSSPAADRMIAQKSASQNSEAYRAYYRGRVLFRKLAGHPNNVDNAIKEFEWALTLDPEFALAMTGLADVYARMANQPKLNAREKYYQMALEMAKRAVNMDPGLAEAHISYAWLKRNYEWDFVGSESHFRKALQISPNHPEAHRQFSFLLTTLGRHKEAVEHARRAVELDPSEQNHIRSYALILTFARQYKEALEQHEYAWRLDPDNVGDHRYVIWALYALGRDKELIERYESLPDGAKGSFQTQTYLALAYRRVGRTSESETLLNTLANKAMESDDSLVRFATTLTTLGRYSEALDLLEEGLRRRDDRMLWVKAQPELQALKGEPRFQAILHQMKIAD